MTEENGKRIKKLEEAEQSLKQSETVLGYLEEAGENVKPMRQKIEKLKRSVRAAKTALKTLQ